MKRISIANLKKKTLEELIELLAQIQKEKEYLFKLDLDTHSNRFSSKINTKEDQIWKIQCEIDLRKPNKKQV